MRSIQWNMLLVHLFLIDNCIQRDIVYRNHLLHWNSSLLGKAVGSSEGWGIRNLVDIKYKLTLLAVKIVKMYMQLVLLLDLCNHNHMGRCYKYCHLQEHKCQ